MTASPIGTKSDVKPAHVRAARGLLDWSQDHLSEVSGVPRRTLIRFESGESVTRQGTLTAIRTALEAAGVEFIPENGGGAGVRLKKP